MTLLQTPASLPLRVPAGWLSTSLLNCDLCESFPLKAQLLTRNSPQQLSAGQRNERMTSQQGEGWIPAECNGSLVFGEEAASSVGKGPGWSIHGLGGWEGSKSLNISVSRVPRCKMETSRFPPDGFY